MTHEGCNNTAALIKSVFASFVTTLPAKQIQEVKNTKTLTNNSKYKTIIKTQNQFWPLCHVRVLSNWTKKKMDEKIIIIIIRQIKHINKTLREAKEPEKWSASRAEKIHSTEPKSKELV